MSLAVPRALIIDIMTEEGFDEEKTAFDWENLGDTKIKKGFHVEQGPISNFQTNQTSNALENELTLRVWQKGFRNESEALQEMLVKMTDILNNILDISNRTNGVKNIVLGDFTPVPISDDNDKIVRGELTLTVKQEICFSL